MNVSPNAQQNQLLDNREINRQFRDTFDYAILSEVFREMAPEERIEDWLKTYHLGGIKIGNTFAEIKEFAFHFFNRGFDNRQMFRWRQAMNFARARWRDDGANRML